MNHRQFGQTGIQVSEIGLGAWQLANPDWGATDGNEALQIVQQSLDAGCNFFDTAPPYNHGRSEEFLGRGTQAGSSRCGYLYKVWPQSRLCD